jgi:hypothetical protein
MLRNVGANVVGVVVAFLTVMLIDMAGHMWYPPPPGLDFSDPDAVRPYLATLPVGAFLFILASSVAAAFIGTLVACYIGTASRLLFGGVVGGVVLAATVANFIAIPHPLWLALGTIAGIVVSTWAATHLAPPATDPSDIDSHSG